MAWTVTRGSTHQMKFMCKDEPNEQLVIGLVSSGLLQSTQDFVASTRKRAHQLQTMQAQKEEEMGGEDDDIGDETTMNPAEKKRRLTVDQVKFLEMSFSMDLKLEPERKAMIAKQLGLRPRQVAIWFQNRRARWKNKQLEHDFEALKTKYEAAVEENDAMVKENEALLEENTRLQAEVAQLRVLVQGQGSSCGGGVMEKSPLLPGSDSDMESGSMKEQKVEVEEAASPAKSDESQSYTSSSCPIMTEAAVLAMVQEAPTTISCTAAKFEPDVALSPSEELLGLISHPLLFQQIATGYQFNQMEDLYSSTWDHHLYGWGSQWDP